MPFKFARSPPLAPVVPRCIQVGPSGTLFRAPTNLFLFPVARTIEDFIAPFPSEHFIDDDALVRTVCRALADVLAGKTLSYTGITTAVTVTLQKFPFFTKRSANERAEITQDYVATVHEFVNFYIKPIPPTRCEVLSMHVIDDGIFVME